MSEAGFEPAPLICQFDIEPGECQTERIYLLNESRYQYCTQIKQTKRGIHRYSRLVVEDNFATKLIKILGKASRPRGT